MKTYIAQLQSTPVFYPPLAREQLINLYKEYLFRPLEVYAETSNGDLIIKEELDLIGRVILQATEQVAKKLRSLGFHLQIKKIP